MEYVEETTRRLPVADRYDIVVAGAGIAGAAAALAAARTGSQVALLERCFAPGGLATLGNVIVYLPLCDGCGRQVIAGIAEELLLRSVADLRSDDPDAGLRRVPACWREAGEGDDAELRERERYKASFNPAAFTLALEEVLLAAGVEIWYDTRACSVIRANERITHLLVENKDGRSAIGCGAVVDATGDADVCALAGERTETLRTNVLAAWHYLIDDGRLVLRKMSRRFSDSGLLEGSDGPFFSGVDARGLTRHAIESRSLVREQLATRRAEQPAHDVQPFALPALPDVRMTRRLVGEATLAGDDVHRWFDDAVGLTGDWRHAGPVWSIPYRAIRGVANANLLVAGRCISSAGRAWDVTRAIPTCALTGEAAGVAAATVCRDGGDARSADVSAIQERLRRAGVLLDPALVEPAG
ncbi:MAG: FAD-dependent oxidoreductase [Spirochaetota bacterium]